MVHLRKCDLWRCHSILPNIVGKKNVTIPNLVHQMCIFLNLRVVRGTYLQACSKTERCSYWKGLHIAQSQIKWAARSKVCFRGLHGQRRPRSDCADAQFEQGLSCPLLESLGTKECSVNSKGRMTLRVNRMMWFRTFCACSKAHFRLTWPNCHDPRNTAAVAAAGTRQDMLAQDVRKYIVTTKPFQLQRFAEQDWARLRKTTGLRSIKQITRERFSKPDLYLLNSYFKLDLCDLK